MHELAEKRAPLTPAELRERQEAGKASAEVRRRGRVRRVDNISREHVQANRHQLFAFGDNMARHGRGGQAAAMRDEANAIGVPTKWHPSSRPGSFFNDADLPAVQPHIDEAFARMHAHLAGGGDVVIPAKGLGIGLADLPRRAPAVMAHINEHIARLEAMPPRGGGSGGDGRHPGETTPSVRQGSSGAPSQRAVGLFQQGRQRPDTRAQRSVWDTRTIEPTIGRIQAKVRFHFPTAYRAETPDPKPKGRLMALALAAAKPRRGRIVTQHQDVVVLNPEQLAEAQRHPEMRAIMQRAVAVAREHQAPTIERAMERGMIPDGVHPSTVIQAYRHAALHAFHKAGVIDYDTAPMDQATKQSLRPLNRFMFYAHRRVYNHLNLGDLQGKWAPFRAEFGEILHQKKHGKLTGVEKPRMRSLGDRFIKLAKGRIGQIAGAAERAFDRPAVHLSMSGAGLGLGVAGYRRGQRKPQPQQVVVVTPAQMREGKLAARAKVLPRLHAGLSLKEAVDAHLTHMGLGPGRVRGSSHPPRPGVQKSEDLNRTHVTINSGLTRPGLGKAAFSFFDGDDDPYTGTLGSFGIDPKRELARAMRPRLRRHKIRLRLNTQRNLRHVLNGGITRQERWQLGAGTRLPRGDLFKGLVGRLGWRTASHFDDLAMALERKGRRVGRKLGVKAQHDMAEAIPHRVRAKGTKGSRDQGAKFGEHVGARALPAAVYAGGALAAGGAAGYGAGRLKKTEARDRTGRWTKAGMALDILDDKGHLTAGAKTLAGIGAVLALGRASAPLRNLVGRDLIIRAMSIKGSALAGEDIARGTKPIALKTMVRRGNLPVAQHHLKDLASSPVRVGKTPTGKELRRYFERHSLARREAMVVTDAHGKVLGLQTGGALGIVPDEKLENALAHPDAARDYHNHPVDSVPSSDDAYFFHVLNHEERMGRGHKPLVAYVYSHGSLPNGKLRTRLTRFDRGYRQNAAGSVDGDRAFEQHMEDNAGADWTAADWARHRLESGSRFRDKAIEKQVPGAALSRLSALAKRTHVDAAADRAEHPTQAQAEAGNYKKGHISLGGLDIAIETPKGGQRSGIGADGTPWQVEMPAHYGYIKRSEGADGDHVDVYLGPLADQAAHHTVFVVNQRHTETGQFDEHKAMLGFPDRTQALLAYDAAFSDGRGPHRRASVRELSWDAFRRWIADGDTTAPLAKGVIGDALAFGARALPKIGGAASAARAAIPKVAGAVGGAKTSLGGYVSRVAASPAGQAIGNFAARHPSVTRAVGAAREGGLRGAALSPWGTAAKVTGAALGAGAKVKRGLYGAGLAAEYAPDVYTYGHIIGLAHGGTQAPQHRSRLGKSLGSTALKVGAGVAAGLGAHQGAQYWNAHPGVRHAAVTLGAAGAVALATRGRGRKLYTGHFKDALREHLRVFGGGTPSPHTMATARRVPRKLRRNAIAGAALGAYAAYHPQFNAPTLAQTTQAIGDEQRQA